MIYRILSPLCAAYRKMNRCCRSILFFATLLVHVADGHNSICIIVHGTWGGQESWYMPGGDFYETLQQEIALYAQNPALVSFSWCGSNNHTARIHAARRLAGLIQSYPEDTVFHLIGHSHGGNILLLACKQLQNRLIETIWTLGTPVSQYYPASMETIKHLYHCYSFDDFVQPVLGFFQRVFPKHERIINMRMEINGKAPNHSELHSPHIAQIIGRTIGTLWFPENVHLSVAHYSANKDFRLVNDDEFPKLAERDMTIMKMFQNICRNHPEYPKICAFITPIILSSLETYPEYH